MLKAALPCFFALLSPHIRAADPARDRVPEWGMGPSVKHAQPVLSPAADSHPPARAWPWKSGTHTLIVDGRTRTFLLDVPKHLQPGAALVLVFHGFTDSAQGIRRKSGFASLAKKCGFVVAYPQGTRDAKGNTFFNVGYSFHQSEKVDDVTFARELSARLVRDLELDPDAVFSTGMSNGGDMSYFLARQPRPFVRAIAPVAGCMMSSWTNALLPQTRISVMEVHGTQDKVTWWAGDPQDREGWGAYLGTEAVMAFWVKSLTLEKSQTREMPGNAAGDRRAIRLHRWWTATDNTEVLLYEIPEGGHEWPSYLGDKDRTTAAVIWDFFKAHCKPRHNSI
jgi:polyhydroxybutyrate depolymerase